MDTKSCSSVCSITVGCEINYSSLMNMRNIKSGLCEYNNIPGLFSSRPVDQIKINYFVFLKFTEIIKKFLEKYQTILNILISNLIRSLGKIIQKLVEFSTEDGPPPLPLWWKIIKKIFHFFFFF